MMMDTGAKLNHTFMITRMLTSATAFARIVLKNCTRT